MQTNRMNKCMYVCVFMRLNGTMTILGKILSLFLTSMLLLLLSFVEVIELWCPNFNVGKDVVVFVDDKGDELGVELI